MIEFANRIPLGMHLSVERRNISQKQHPVRDASLTGCTRRSLWIFSTERHIPNGMRCTEPAEVTKLLYVYYFHSIIELENNVLYES